MLTSTLTTKGQVTIPKKIREMLGARTNDRIVFTPIEPGKVLITTESTPASALFGLLRHRKPKQAVSVEAMKEVIKSRRLARAGK